MIIGKDIFQASKTILLFELVYKKYRLFAGRSYGIYKNSLLYAKTEVLFNGIIVILRYSFLGRITEIKEEDNLKEVLESSGFVKWLLKIRGGWGKGIDDCLKTSFIVRHAIRFKNELYVSPVKAWSIIVVTAILSNVFFYALFKNAMCKDTGLLSWIIEAILLFVGLAGLFSEAGLKDLISTSLFVKWINHNRQSELEEK